VSACTFSPGLRLSTIDVIVLLVGGLISASIAALAPWFGIALAFVIGHFFLFCNVFRMARSRELVWAVVFVVLSASTAFIGLPHWPVTLTISFVATVLLVVVEMRQPSYHGAFWRRINPDLPQWWAQKTRHVCPSQKHICGETPPLEEA
jgi:hypothetical protein